MPAIENAELKITPAVPPAAMWRIEVRYTLVVPYWEVGSWCRETAEVVEGEAHEGGTEVLRWRSDPWQIVAEGEPPDGACFRIRRQVPAHLAGSSVLDVNPDRTTVNAVELAGEEPVLVVWLTNDRRLDRLHARIAVEPVSPMGGSAVTGLVAGQFGPR